MSDFLSFASHHSSFSFLLEVDVSTHVCVCVEVQMQVITAVFSACQVLAASRISFHLDSSSLRWMMLLQFAKEDTDSGQSKGLRGRSTRLVWWRQNMSSVSVLRNRLGPVQRWLKGRRNSESSMVRLSCFLVLTLHSSPHGECPGESVTKYSRRHGP